MDSDIPENPDIPEMPEKPETIAEAPLKRGRGRPRKVPVQAAAPVPPPEPEYSLRDVLARLDGVEKRLASRSHEEESASVGDAAQSAMGHRNARRSHNRALFASFMPK
jgi:hypothetical protein